MTAVRTLPRGRLDPAEPAAAERAATLAAQVVTASGDGALDSLLALLTWRGPGSTVTRISCSFAGAEPVWLRYYGPELADGQPLTAAPQEAVRAALASWARLAPIEFVEVADDHEGSGVMRFARTSATPAAHAYLPGGGEAPGDLWLGYGPFGDDADLRPGTCGFATRIHEIGHALGLKHPHGTAGSGVVLPAGQDWIGASIMSYRSAPAEPVTAGYAIEFYPTTPMPLDVAAIRYLYAGRGSAGSSDELYRPGPGERIVQTLDDPGGIDTLDWSARRDAARIDLEPGAGSQLGEPFRATRVGGAPFIAEETLWISAESIIENALGGAGDDVIGGNAAANVLRGVAGDDLLRGLAGDDRLDGGAGRDRLRGSAGDDVLRGKAGADQLAGGAGDDLLHGGAGRDVAIFTGARADYRIEALADGTASVTGRGAQANAGSDALVAIELLRFADLSLRVPVAGV